MTSRLGSALSSCTNKYQSETVEVITADDAMPEDSGDQYGTNHKDDEPTVKITTVDQPQPSFLWRLSSGAIGGAYNVASGAAGMGYNTTKWVLGKGAEVGSTVYGTTKDVSGSVISKTAEVGSTIVGKLPVPAKLKGKDKKE